MVYFIVRIRQEIQNKKAYSEWHEQIKTIINSNWRDLRKEIKIILILFLIKKTKYGIKEGIKVKVLYPFFMVIFLGLLTII